MTLAKDRSTQVQPWSSLAERRNNMTEITSLGNLLQQLHQQGHSPNSRMVNAAVESLTTLLETKAAKDKLPMTRVVPTVCDAMDELDELLGY